MEIKNLLFTTFATLLSVSFAIAQPTIEWQKSLGGLGNDNSYSIQQTNDGGYIVSGVSDSNDGDVSGNHGNTDFWVMKLTSIGTIEWQKSLGGTSDEDANSIQQTNDGGYIVVGGSESNDGDVSGNHGSQDIWVVKLNITGAIEWQKSLGGTESESAFSIQQTNEGGYIVLGVSFSNDGDVSGNHGNGDYWAVKLSSIGTIEWQKSLGGTGQDVAFSIQQTTDGGYIVAGGSGSNDGDVTGNHGASNDYWVLKLSSIGTIEWQKSLGGTGQDFAFSIQQTTDAGYIVAGLSNSNDGDVSGNHGASLDYWVVKISSLGAIEWQKSLGGSNSDQARSIQQTNDGGYIVTGESDSNDGDVSGNHGSQDIWVVKLNITGAIEWQKSLGGTESENVFTIQQTNDGGFIVAGGSSSNDGDVSGNHGDVDCWLVKLASSQQSIENFQPDLFSVFPNPAQNTIHVKTDNKLIGKPYVIYDNTARVVLSGKLNAENTIIELSSLSGGSYLFSVGENLQQTFKIIKE